MARKMEGFKPEADDGYGADIGLLPERIEIPKAAKKGLYLIAFVLSLIGACAALVMVFILNDAIDKTKAQVDQNLADLRMTLLGLDSALAQAEDELDSTDESISSLKAPLAGIADGLRGTGQTIDDLGGTLTSIYIPGLDLSGTGEGFSDSADSFAQSADEMDDAASQLDEHGTNLLGLKDSIRGLRDDVKEQRNSLAKTQMALDEVFGLIKLANILLFVVVMSMFAIPLMNSAAGLI